MNIDTRESPTNLCLYYFCKENLQQLLIVILMSKKDTDESILCFQYPTYITSILSISPFGSFTITVKSVMEETLL